MISFYMNAKLTYWMGSFDRNPMNTIFTGVFEAETEIEAKALAMDALRKARGNLEKQGYRVREDYSLVPIG